MISFPPQIELWSRICMCESKKKSINSDRVPRKIKESSSVFSKSQSISTSLPQLPAHAYDINNISTSYQSFLDPASNHAFNHNLHPRSCIFTPSRLSRSMRSSPEYFLYNDRYYTMLCRWAHGSMFGRNYCIWQLRKWGKVFFLWHRGH